jgi:hypothetical protein
MWPHQGQGGALFPAPAGGHGHECYLLRADLDSTPSAQLVVAGGGGGSGCLGVSTVGLTPPVATEWIADSGASLQMRVSFLLSDLLTPLVLPSWSVMALVFRSLLWVQLTVLFVSLMSLLLLR